MLWRINFYHCINVVDSADLKTQSELDALRALLEKDIIKMQYEIDDYYSTTLLDVKMSSSYLISFVLIAYCDEKLARKADEDGLSYELLQTRYKTYTAGELFYQYLENILSEPSHTLDIYDCYEFLLRHGFEGKHPIKTDQFQRGMYLKHLQRFTMVSGRGRR